MYYYEKGLEALGKPRSAYQKKERFIVAVRAGQHANIYTVNLANAVASETTSRKEVVNSCRNTEAHERVQKEQGIGKYSIDHESIRKGMEEEQETMKKKIAKLELIIKNGQGHHASYEKYRTAAMSVENKSPKAGDFKCTVKGCLRPTTHPTERCWLTQKCNKCDTMGHIARNCPNAKDDGTNYDMASFLLYDEFGFEGPDMDDDDP